MSSLTNNSLDKVRKDARLLRDYGNHIETKNRERFVELRKTNNTLRSLVTEKRTGGQKLTQAAAVLLLAPDPITGAAALPVLLAAQIKKMKSEKRSDLQRILDGANENFTSLLSSAELSYL